MSDNRELLELAAKAAGYVVEFMGEDAFRNGQMGYWNPLEDDGDAFRLAVTLGINVTFGSTMVNAEREQPEEVASVELFRDDPYAATRRAIVQAAAEIGTKNHD